jgi:hypothetical protein
MLPIFLLHKLFQSSHFAFQFDFKRILGKRSENTFQLKNEFNTFNFVLRSWLSVVGVDPEFLPKMDGHPQPSQPSIQMRK